MPAARTERTVAVDFVCAGAVAAIVFVILFTPITRHTRRIGFILHGWSPGLRIECALLPSQFPSGVSQSTFRITVAGAAVVLGLPIGSTFPHSHFIPLTLSVIHGEPCRSFVPRDKAGRQGRMRRHKRQWRRVRSLEEPPVEVFRARRSREVVQKRNILWITRRILPDRVRFR